MAKSELKIQARKLRESGIGVNNISLQLKVAKSTVSSWVRDIILTVDQLERLRNNSIVGAERGRLQSALNQKQKRLSLIEKYKKDGISNIDKLNKRELLIAGVALYWAEGSKASGQASFCNSDPTLVNFMIKWFEQCLNVDKSRMAVKVGINQIHRGREEVVKKYWSDIVDIPLSQFRKTSFKKVFNKKKYSNFNEHYGTLEIKILKPSLVYYKILGLIYGLSKSR